ncbi:MAG: FxsA family protein, partial [Pseudomonadales bacterium]
MRFLFLLFIFVPIIEITVLIQVGQWIGALFTIALVVLTAFIGINMIRAQGLATLNRANWRIQSGQLPA